jgi:hypothetical protein
MVSVGLYSRTIIPTIRGVDATCPHSNSGQTTANAYTVASGGGYSHQTLPAGETAFFSSYGYGHQNSSYYYHQIRSSEDLTQGLVDDNNITLTTSKYNAGGLSLSGEYKNTTGAPITLQLWHYSGTSGNYNVSSYWNRFMRMNDSDLAKWERVNLPTTRYRKYAVDKYYMLAKWHSGSFNIDGYQVNTQGGTILEVPVETIISSTALTGSGQHFFQVTGQGFTVTP